MSDGRADTTLLASRRRWRLGCLLLAALLALVGWVAVADPGQPAPASLEASSTSRPLPAACADALDLGDLLASHTGPLSGAANDHVDVMKRLDLFLEGKPGGLTGRQAYQRGEAQMAVMEEHGPDAEVQSKRYREVRRRCPLK